MGEEMKDIWAGDIIFVRSRGILSNVIRWITKGHWNHVGLVSGKIEDHTLICEAGRSGIDINDLVWRKIRKENYSIYRLEGITAHQRSELVQQCLSWVGVSYDYPACLNFITWETWFGNAKEMICSEMLYRALRGLNLIDDVFDPEEVSPADLFRELKDRIVLVKKVEF